MYMLSFSNVQKYSHLRRIMQRGIDIDMLRNFVKLYDFTAIFSKTNKNIFCLALFIIPLMVCIGLYFFELVLMSIKEIVSPVEKICFLASSCSVLAYNIICLKDLFCNGNVWKDMVQYIQVFDLKINKSRNKKISCTYYLKFIVTATCFAIVYLWYNADF